MKRFPLLFMAVVFCTWTAEGQDIKSEVILMVLQPLGKTTGDMLFLKYGSDHMPHEEWKIFLSQLSNRSRDAVIDQYYARLSEGAKMGNCAASREFYRAIGLLFWAEAIAGLANMAEKNIPDWPRAKRIQFYADVVDGFSSGDGFPEIIDEWEQEQ